MSILSHVHVEFYFRQTFDGETKQLYNIYFVRRLRRLLYVSRVAIRACFCIKISITTETEVSAYYS